MMNLKSVRLNGQVRSQTASFYPPPKGTTDLPWTIRLYKADVKGDRWQRHQQAANLIFSLRPSPQASPTKQTETPYITF